MKMISLGGPQLLNKEKQCTLQQCFIIPDQELYASEHI